MDHKRALKSKLRRSYLALLLLLPIVIIGVRFLALWHPHDLHRGGVAVSTDGTRFAILSKIGRTGRCKLTIGDGNLKRVKSLSLGRCRAQGVCLSSNGDKVAVRSLGSSAEFVGSLSV